jgi:hypothetical protein
MTSSPIRSSSPAANGGAVTPALAAGICIFLGVVCCVAGVYLLLGLGYALLATAGFYFIVAWMFVRGINRGG